MDTLRYSVKGRRRVAAALGAVVQGVVPGSPPRDGDVIGSKAKTPTWVGHSWRVHSDL